MPVFKKIIAIGDSITYGFPYMQCLSWVHLAHKQLSILMINKGENGNTTAQMLARFEDDVMSLLPSHVIIMGGTNDACLRVEAVAVQENIRKMAEIALRSGVVPIIGLPIPCNFSQDEYILGLYREEMREYALAEGLILLDFYTAFLTYNSRQPRGEFYSDVLHPNERGYEAMAAVAVKVLQERISGKGNRLE